MGHNQGKQWFVDRMGEQGLSLSEVARRMGIDKSALSRAFDGRRQVKVPEVDEIATILKVTPKEVFDHAKSIPKKASSRKKAGDETSAGSPDGASGSLQDDPIPTGKRRPLYPGFGFMKGLIKIEPGFDVTGPFSDESWEDGYLGEDRLGENYVGKGQK